ncbi:hypothetical protein RSP03_44660 [Cereibacter sphaeroides]|nr:hypothetical protein RSP03_44660 [Cereibacter sphaeroides]
MYRDKFAEITAKGQSPICPDCLRVMELERLARNSTAANNRNEKRIAP